MRNEHFKAPLKNNEEDDVEEQCEEENADDEPNDTGDDDDAEGDDDDESCVLFFWSTTGFHGQFGGHGPLRASATRFPRRSSMPRVRFGHAAGRPTVGSLPNVHGAPCMCCNETTAKVWKAAPPDREC